MFDDAIAEFIRWLTLLTPRLGNPDLDLAGSFRESYLDRVFFFCLPAYRVSFFFVFLLFSGGMLLQSIYQPCFHCELPVCPTVQRVGAKLSLTAPALLSHLLRTSTGNLSSIKGAELWHQIESWIHVGVQVSSVCNQFSSFVSNPSYFIILALGGGIWITDGRGWWKNRP